MSPYNVKSGVYSTYTEEEVVGEYFNNVIKHLKENEGEENGKDNN